MDNNIYVTKAQKKKGIVAMIFGIIGGALLIVCPFMNFATMHFQVDYGFEFKFLVDSLTGHEETPEDYEEVTLVLDYGLDMFELRKMGSNLSGFRLPSKEDKEISATVVEETRDMMKYVIDFEGMGIYFNEDAFDELFGIIYLADVGYVPLCIVPFLLIGLGGLIILSAAKRWGVPQLIASIIATGAGIWLITFSNDFLTIVGIGGIVMIAAFAICLISSICVIVTKK